MKIVEIQDKYNPNKIWLIKKKESRNYLYSQKICGQQIYPFQDTTIKFLAAIFETYPEELQKKFKDETKREPGE